VSTGSLANGLELLAGAEPAPVDLRADAPSLPAELTAAARTWKVYVQGATDTCTRSDRDPFTHIPAVADDCAFNDVALTTFEGDFTDTEQAPSLAWILPDPCHDGSETGCTDTTDGATGLARADAWLREWIPKITGSEAFADDGLLVVLFDGGGVPEPAAGADWPAVGAVVVSRFAGAGKVSAQPYDHLSLLRTLAGTFGVDPPGDAAGEDVTPFGHDVFPKRLATTSRSQNVRTAVTSR
jgi:phosphatidylinositol-3-phosphatase